VKKLLEIYAAIDERCRSTIQDHPGWPCTKGCGMCCERLSREPELTEAEWTHLAEGIDALAPTIRERVATAIVEQPTNEGELVVCPLLDRDAGACLVYDHRPAACRTYGFFARRTDTLACSMVVDHAANKDVMWGNHERIDHDLGSGSNVRTLREWFSRRDNPDRSPR